MKSVKELIGMEVMIYEDPFMKQNEEGRATITDVIEQFHSNGVCWADCIVRFEGEKEMYTRTITYKED